MSNARFHFASLESAQSNSFASASRESIGPQISTLRCDHCRNKLGQFAHRYWRMRFCSAACVAAYQHRLGEETKVKIQRLRFALTA